MNDESKEVDGVKSDVHRKLKEHLEAWDIVGASGELQKEEHRAWLAENAWELIPLITSYINRDMHEKCPQLIQSCGELLITIAEEGVAKETLVGLLENCEPFTYNVKFRKCLPALAIVLSKMKTKTASWSWAFSTLNLHMEAYAIPESPKLEGRERLLAENAADVRNMVDTMDDILSFLRSLIDSGQDQADVIVVFILRLFHKPLTYLNLHLEEDGYKPRARKIAEELLSFLVRVSPNLIILLYLEDERRRIRRRRKASSSSSLQEDDDNDDDDEESLSDFSIGTLCYLVFGEEVLLESIPQVYDHFYLFHEILPLVNKFLGQKHEMAVYKGLLLFRGLIRRLPKQSLQSGLLESETHHSFLKSITDVIIYHDLREYRTLAFDNFTDYFEHFQIRARYKFFNYVIQVSNHSGLIGIIVTKLKDTVLWNLDRGCPMEEFRGNHLKMLLRKLCKLSNGPETDLLEVSDELLSALNALYCLFLRDKAENKTGIWDLKDELYKNFLEPLQTGIKLSKAHYNLKLKGESKEDGKNGPDVTMMVGGQKLPQMSPNEMKKVMNSALMTLDVMDSAAQRLEKVLK